MRALLDTHSFLWFIGGSPKLSPQVRSIIADLENEVLVSMASLWEIAIKASIGKLTLARPFAEFIPKQLEKQQIAVLGIELAQLSLFRQGLMLYELLPRMREDRLRALMRRFGELLRHHVLFTGILGVV